MLFEQDEEMKDLREQLQRLQEARESCCKGMGEGEGQERRSEG